MDKTEEIARDLLANTIALLRVCGLPPSKIVDFVRLAAEEDSTSFGMDSIDGSLADHMAATDVVYTWRHDPEFTDDRGYPRAIPERCAPASFETLVGIAAPGYDSERLLAHLELLGAVRKASEGSVELVTESVLLCSGVNGGYLTPTTLLQHIQGFLSSVSFNVLSKTDNSQGRFERACYGWLPDELVPIFERMVEERGQNFVDAVDEWLARHRVPPGPIARGSSLVGAGAYVFVRPNKNK